MARHASSTAREPRARGPPRPERRPGAPAPDRPGGARPATAARPGGRPAARGGPPAWPRGRAPARQSGGDLGRPRGRTGPGRVGCLPAGAPRARRRGRGRRRAHRRRRAPDARPRAAGRVRVGTGRREGPTAAPRRGIRSRFPGLAGSLRIILVPLADGPDTIVVVEPSVGSVGRTKGHLYLLVTSKTPGNRAREATRVVADTIRNEYYYDESAGIRQCLIKVLGIANKRLAHQRDRYGLGHDDGSGPIGVAVAVVRGREMYVATVGPAEA